MKEKNFYNWQKLLECSHDQYEFVVRAYGYGKAYEQRKRKESNNLKENRIERR